MTLLYEFLQEVDGKGVSLHQRGYPVTSMAREAMLLGYRLSDLNKNDLARNSIGMKNIAQTVSTTEDGKKVKWKSEDLKIKTVEIDVRTSATSYDVDTTDVQVGESLYNQRTGTTVVVTASSAGTITLNGSGDTASLAGDILVRTSYSKPYGVDGNMTVGRNDVEANENYIQYTEFGKTFTSIELNKNYTFLTTVQEYVGSRIGDMVRRTIVNQAQSFFVGVAGEITAGGNTYYTAAGVKSLLPAGYKNININGSTDAGTLKKLEAVMDTAYGSGIDVEGNKMAAFVNQKMLSKITSLVDSKLVYNDVIRGIDMTVTYVRLAGQELMLVRSDIIESINNTFAEGYIIPVEDCFMFNIPVDAIDGNGKPTPSKTAHLYLKPVSTPESVELALYSKFSFVFPNIASGAYQHFYFI
jgi:hypothetical protein